MHLQHRHGGLDLSRVAVMGILNVTPDSFSDGGLWLDPDRAVAHALEMVDEGADIIDVGGESTRPGARDVSEQEELERILPVISALRERVEVPISIDTRKPAVAREAMGAGAAFINDTLGEEAVPEMDVVAAETTAGVVVMHSRGTPATMKTLVDYDDLVADVASSLVSRAERLQAAGVARDAIAIDPGIGFAKSVEQNLELLRRLDELVVLGYPVLIGTSRKSFLGAILGTPEADRLEGTIASVVHAVIKGARIVRVHDVEPVRRAIATLEAIEYGVGNE